MPEEIVNSIPEIEGGLKAVGIYNVCLYKNSDVYIFYSHLHSTVSKCSSLYVSSCNRKILPVEKEELNFLQITN